MSETYDSQQIKEMFTTATRWLELNVEAINSLNVFPVPDGDTGTNMLFTMRATMEEAYKCPDSSVSALAKAMAWGALMGARGNSGVIMSQVLRGFANGLGERTSMDGRAFAAALKEASTSAYKAVSKPVEGTMLTVIREVSQVAHEAAQEREDLEGVLEAAVRAAEESVARTPSLLPILRETGVVDAGGQGLLTILEGLLKSLRHESIEAAPRLAESEAISRLLEVAKPGKVGEEHQLYGYCAQFLIQGKGLDLALIREKINRIGESTVVVGDEYTVRVHTHSFEPAAVIGYAESLGDLSGVSVQDIDEQHAEILQAKEAIEGLPIATVVVASGEGLKELLASLGATMVVVGGQTMNPSTQELLTAIETVPAPEVVVLPNNKNIVLAAQQAASLSEKVVEVVPTSSIPQGIASMLAFNVESGLEENLGAMKSALSGIRTVELTRAVRPARINGIKVEEGDAIGLWDGQLLASAPGLEEVVQSLTDRLQSGGYSLATVYYGAAAGSADKQRVLKSLRRCLPGAEVAVVDGGQPDYDFIISLE